MIQSKISDARKLPKADCILRATLGDLRMFFISNDLKTNDGKDVKLDLSGHSMLSKQFSRVKMSYLKPLV